MAGDNKSESTKGKGKAKTTEPAVEEDVQQDPAETTEVVDTAWTLKEDIAVLTVYDSHEYDPPNKKAEQVQEASKSHILRSGHDIKSRNRELRNAGHDAKSLTAKLEKEEKAAAAAAKKAAGKK